MHVRRGDHRAATAAPRGLRLRAPPGHEAGVSGAVTAMLLILILGSAVGLIYSVYIPVWTKDAEAEQMSETQRQFLNLKETLDTQVLAPEASIGTTVTTRISLGRDGGPIMGVGGTTGELVVDPLAGRMEVYNSLDPIETYGLGRGTVSFQSHNQQYLQQQITYELGAVFIAQTDGAVMKVPPNVAARNTTRGLIELSVTLPALVGTHQQISGTGSYVIKSTLKVVDSNDFAFASTDVELNLTTAYPQLWGDFLTQLFTNSTLTLAEWDITTDVPTGNVIIVVRGVDLMSVKVAVLEIELL